MTGASTSPLEQLRDLGTTRDDPMTRRPGRCDAGCVHCAWRGPWLSQRRGGHRRGRGDHQVGRVLVDVGAALTAQEIAATRPGRPPGPAPTRSRPARCGGVPGDDHGEHTRRDRRRDRYLTEAGITGGVVTASGRRVTVHATVHRRTQLLSALGIAQVSGSATSTAIALYGNGVEGGG